MKYSLRILAYIVSTLFLVSASYAKTANCLPIDVVANAQFTQATKIEYGDVPNVWVFTSDNIQYQDQEWNIVFGVVLPNAKSAQNALEMGQIYFSNVTLYEPKAKSGICEYASMDQTYMVLSSTPPIRFPQANLSLFLK